MGLDVDEIEVPYYIQKFVIGYDDLVDWKPSGKPAVFRYGKNWIVNCRIKAWNTGYVNPAAQGERDELEIITETEIEFKFEIFRDDLFTISFADGDVVDIGADSMENQTIYVQAQAEIANPGFDFMLHFKFCRVQELVQNATTAQWDIVADEFDFMIDGCMSTLQFISNNFGMYYNFGINFDTKILENGEFRLIILFLYILKLTLIAVNNSIALFIFELKRRRRVPCFISSQSPIEFVNMGFIDWLELRFKT